MQKFLILSLLIGIVLSVEPEVYSPCVLATPESPEECFSLAPEFFRQTCCYFEGTYDIGNGTFVTGKACLEANRIDVSNGTIKHKTQEKIEKGEYWPDYPGIKDIKSFLCYGAISECETKQPVDNENECFNAKAELTSEGCCYLKSDWKEGNRHEKEVIGACVDIKLVDSATAEKMEETKKRILNGSYWDGDFGEPTKIEKFVCANTKSTNSSVFMKLNFLILSLLFFMF